MFPPAASRPDAPLFTSRPRQLDTATAVRGARRYRVFRHALLLRPSESSSVHTSTAALANPTARDGSGREGECVRVQVQVLFLRRSTGRSCSAGRSRSGWLERITTVRGVPRCIFPPPPADKFFCARAHGNFRELDGREATSGAHPWQARWGALDRLVWL